MIALSIALAAGTGLAGLAAPSAFAGIDGGVDMNAACVNQYGPGWDANFDYRSGNVYSWYCEYFGSGENSINVQEQCVAQYGPGATALFSDYNNPWSWYCLT